MHAAFSVRAGGLRSDTARHIKQSPQYEAVFHRGKKPEPEPAPEAQARTPADDIKEIKDWITDTADPKFTDLADREQRNRDSITNVNGRCTGNNTDIRKLWKEKDTEKQARDLEISDLRRTIRQLKIELSKKADKAKTTKPDKA